MKIITKLLLIAGLVSFSFNSGSTTLTIYSINGECKYILSENNQPIASWVYTCTPELGRSMDITIIEGSSLAKKIKEIRLEQNLKNIKVIHLADQEMISKMELLQIPALSLHNFKIKKNIQINTVINSNALAPAQDYNSSRSNKANSIATNPLYEDKGTSGNNPMYDNKNKIGSGGNKDSSLNNKPNSISTAQDYNSSRSNKANSIAPAQDYNSSRSNKANSIATNPLYEDKGTGGNNPMYDNKNKIGSGGNKDSSINNKPNSISPAQDYNSSRSNKANSIATAQDYNSSRSNKANSLMIDGGFTNSNSSQHIGNGLSLKIGYQASLNKIISAEIGIAYFKNKLDYKPSPLFPEKYKLSMQKNIREHSWNIITINAGPAISMGKRRLYATLYGKAGISFIKTPEQFVGATDDNNNVTEKTGFARFSGNKTAFSVQTGIRINYAISHKVDVFIHPYFFTLLGSNSNYSEKDITKSLNADGQFDYEEFMNLPFQKKPNRFQVIGLNAGFKIHCF